MYAIWRKDGIGVYISMDRIWTVYQWYSNWGACGPSVSCKDPPVPFKGGEKCNGRIVISKIALLRGGGAFTYGQSGGVRSLVQSSLRSPSFGMFPNKCSRAFLFSSSAFKHSQMFQNSGSGK